MNIPLTCTIVNVLRGWSILLVSDSDGGETELSAGLGSCRSMTGEGRHTTAGEGTGGGGEGRAAAGRLVAGPLPTHSS